MATGTASKREGQDRGLLLFGLVSRANWVRCVCQVPIRLRAALLREVPIGYEDHFGFHYGTEPHPLIGAGAGQFE